jgi:hypothetical protein
MLYRKYVITVMNVTGVTTVTGVTGVRVTGGYRQLQ